MAEPKRPEAVAEAQARYLKLHPACEISGIVGSCDAHHKIPYGYLCAIDREDVAEMMDIFITLATPTHRLPDTPNWHEKTGHLGSYESFDPDFEDHLSFYLSHKDNLGLLLVDPTYMMWVMHRPAPAHLQTQDFLAILTAKVLQRYGPKKEK